jgi:hypothetical protein
MALASTLAGCEVIIFSYFCPFAAVFMQTFEDSAHPCSSLARAYNCDVLSRYFTQKFQ